MKTFARHSAFWVLLSLLLAPLAVSHAAPGPKIQGPWLWMIVPTGDKGGAAAAASGIDWLAEVSGGAVTEQQIAKNGAVAGDLVGNRGWTWGALTPTGLNNITDMVHAMQIGLGDDWIDNHVAYGWIALDSPQQQNTTMYVGSDDAVKVWLNGTLVHNNPVDRGASDYQDEFPITLKQGKNTLLVAVYQGWADWSGFFGFEDGTMYSRFTPDIADIETVPVVVADRFGRAVNDAGITLVDWEGHIGNPAIQYTVKAPSSKFFTWVELSASDQKLYFNLPSEAGAEGPRKSFSLDRARSATFHMSVFPDRDGQDETHLLTIEYLDDQGVRYIGTVDIHVIDQDRPRRGLSYGMTVDFSYDETGLYDDAGARRDTRNAAQDWVYFFDGTGLDEVPAGQEQSGVLDAVEGWPTQRTVYNKEPYTGFLLYAAGSFVGTGGGPCPQSGYQSVNGETLPLRRSGDITMQKSGNWGTELGWDTGVPDEKWWSLSTLDGAHDFYSIALHEIGHALIFNPGYPKLQEFMELGYINSKKVRDYYAAFVPKYLNDDIDRSFLGEYIPFNVNKDGNDHLPLGLVDTISRRHGWFGEMPHGRELPTKGELLIAEAIGYTLRETTPFMPLSIPEQTPPAGTEGAPYEYTAEVNGGIPAYYWAIQSGSLPEGLALDSFTGTISGTPSQHGTFNFTISVNDYDETTTSTTRAVTLRIDDEDEDSTVEPDTWLTPDPATVAFSADDPAWKTFTVHTNLDSVLVRANPSGSDLAIEIAGGQNAPTRDFCPAEGNDRPSSGRRDGWNLHVKACQAGQTKIQLIDYDTREVLQQYEINVEASTSEAAATALNPSHPNPFNSETILSYTLKAASDIRLEVFALNGQRIAVLHEGFQAAGYHAVSVDASEWASGVYLYRLTTPEGRFAQKFTLLR